MKGTIHLQRMHEAFKMAKIAYQEGEVPIGAVAYIGDQLVAKAYNQVETLQDCTAHAEMLIISSLTEKFQSKYFKDVSLYVTVEPCVMCAGALKWAQISELHYGVHEPKSGFTLYGNLLHPKTQIYSGYWEEEITTLLKEFFRTKR